MAQLPPSQNKDPVSDLYTQNLMPIGYFRQSYLYFGTNAELRRAILKDTRIEAGFLENPDGMIPLSSQIQQIKNLVSLFGESFALDATNIWQPAAQGALDVAFRSSPTIGIGLQYLANYSFIRIPFIEIHISEKKNIADKNGIALTLKPNITIEENIWRIFTQVIMLSLQTMIGSIIDAIPQRTLTTQTHHKIDLSHIDIYWPWSRPIYYEKLNEMIPATHTFNASNCHIFIPNSISNLKSPYADQFLLEITLSQLNKKNRKNQERETTSQQVRTILSRHSINLNDDNQIPGAQSIAEQLNISRRTLVRRLKDEGKSFRQLHDQILKERAEHMITTSQKSRDKIAADLGYSDGTSLNRACQRWFGLSFHQKRQTALLENNDEPQSKE